MKILPQKILVIVSLLVGGAYLSHADTTTTFQQGVDGYAGVKDTYIWKDNPSLNYGGSGTFIASYGANSGVSEFDLGREERDVLLGFDLSSLAGQTVTSATITLTVSTVGNRSEQSSSVIYAYELLKDWTEGSNTGQWASGGTWNNSTSGVAWETPGAQGASDRDLDPFYTSDTLTLNGTNPSVVAGDTLTITLTNEMVQSWIDNPSENYGILISLATQNGWRYPALVFFSSESGENGPVLTVNTIPEPSQMVCLVGLLVGLSTWVVRRRKSKVC